MIISLIRPLTEPVVDVDQLGGGIDQLMASCGGGFKGRAPAVSAGASGPCCAVVG